MFIEAVRPPPRAKPVTSIGYPDSWLVLLHQAVPFAAAAFGRLARRARPALDDLGMASAAMTTTILGQLLIDSHAAEGTISAMHCRAWDPRLAAAPMCPPETLPAGRVRQAPAQGPWPGLPSPVTMTADRNS